MSTPSPFVSRQPRRLSTVAAPLPRDYYRRTSCRVCKSRKLTEFLAFGPMPLANAYRPEDESTTAEPRYPLSVAYCSGCGLVQVPDVVSPHRLFGAYHYFTSASWPMVDHFRRVAGEICGRYVTDPGDLICEVGSNDGVFLQHLVGKCRVVGVDPASNIIGLAARKGVQTVNRFFGPQTARAVRTLFGRAKVIFSANCLAHIDDLDEVLEGVTHLLAEDGVLVFENHRFADMLRTGCFDQIYHEHLAYYTLRPLEILLARFGLRVIDVQVIPTHGQSFQIHAARDHAPYPVQPSVANVRQEEEALQLNDIETYRQFAGQVAETRQDLRHLLYDLRSRGCRVAGYGAPAKASTLLNHCGIGHQVLDYVVDSTPIKQGRCVPGTKIPIRHPGTLAANPPDYVLLLAWNYADAVLRQEQALRTQGVRFILPFPKPHIV